MLLVVIFSFDVDKVLFQFSSVWLSILAEKLEIIEQVFNNSTPLKAEGVNLFQKGSYVGITRKQANRAEGEATFTGNIGIQIPTNFQISTVDGIIFLVVNGGTITDSNRKITLKIIAQEEGEIGNVQANTITEIVSPMLGLESVTNLLATTKGQEQETESQFRSRYFDKLDEGFGTNVDGIASAIRELSGVKDALVYENDQDIEVNGISPHSIAPFVLGGLDKDIAQRIFDVKPGGIRSFGNIEITVVDSQGFSHIIGFTRPNDINVYVKLTLIKTIDYPADGDNQIKQSVVSYIDNLGLGKHVYPYQISSNIANLGIKGIDNITVKLSTDGITYTSDPVTIQKNEVAITDINKVVIE